MRLASRFLLARALQRATMAAQHLLAVVVTTAILSSGSSAWTATITFPYNGITRITDSVTLPAPADVSDPGFGLGVHVAHVNVIKINLLASGLSFKLSPGTTGATETTTQQTLAFMNQENAQLAINAHFFDPNNNPTNLTGVAASLGNVYSPFQVTGVSDLNYAITTYAPAINISNTNVAKVVYRGGSDTTLVDAASSPVAAYNTISGSAQIITNGVKTLPAIGAGGVGGGVPVKPSTSPPLHWYTDQIAARTGIGLSQDGNLLFLFTVDAAGGSAGMTVSEEASYLLANYGVYNALNLDGGGSTTLAMQDPTTHIGSVINAASGGPRSVGSSLAILASPVPEPSTIVLLVTGVVSLFVLRARRRSGQEKRPASG